MSKIGIDNGGGGGSSSITLMGNTGSISGTSFTISGSGVLSSSATGSTVSFVSTAANIIHSSSGDATASSNAFTIVGAGTVTTSATGSTLTITGSSGAGFTWLNTTGSTQSMSVGNGYIDNGSGTPTIYTLPITAPVGSVVGVQGFGAGLWKIAQNSGQTIYANGANSTTGTGGSVTSTESYDSALLICVTANIGWVVNQMTGNLSVV